MDMNLLAQSLARTFAGCNDYEVRETVCGASVFCLRMLTDKQYASEKVLKVLNGNSNATYLNLNALEMNEVKDEKEAASEMLSGSVVVCFPDGKTVSCGADRQVGRSVDEPDTEVTVYGGHAGFVENLDTNVALIRRTIRSEKLKSYKYTIGENTNTPVCLLYMESLAKESVVSFVKEKMENANLRSALDSGNIASLIEGENVFFATTGKSEKLSKVCAQLLSGRVAVVVDGNPFVITVPFVFAQTLQSSEDYVKNPVYSTFVRFLRFSALLIALYLPALFTAVVYSPVRLIPLEMMMALTENHNTIAFGVFGELLASLFIFEIIREVGLRMPRAVGDSVGILASIILGDAAVRAGIASSVVIMIAALSAIANFAVPAYKDSSVLLRFLLLFSAYSLSFAGIAAVTVWLVSSLVMTDSCGVPYLTPLAPLIPSGLKDFILSIPGRTTKEGDAGISNE